MTVDRAWAERNLGYDPISRKPPPETFAFKKAAASSAKPEDYQREMIDFDSQGPEGTALFAFSKATGLSRFTDIPWPKGLAPKTGAAPGKGSGALPRADVLVVTWTVDEGHALSRVLTPGKDSSNDYRPYKHNYAKIAKTMSRRSPAVMAKRLGTYWTCTIGKKKVVVFKSDSHMSQDTDKHLPTNDVLPNAVVWKQIIEEVQPELVLTIGTSGSVFQHFQLGDVVVTRAAKFRCKDEFRNEKFNGETFQSDWPIPLTHLDEATSLMQVVGPNMAEPPMLPPTINYHYHGSKIHSDVNVPDIKLDGRDMPAFHPILTTDYFEYGTSTNNLDVEGAAVEMGDAVLGLAVDGMPNPPKWAVVRNMSDPQINGGLPNEGYDMNPQTMWAIGYYTGYGYYTSVSGAIATWGIIAGL